VLILKAASFESSGLARLCIFLRASRAFIIFSFQRNFALHSSALNSLYLEKAIAIIDASIQKIISKTITIAK
jgi:hypothetical protein